MSITSYPHIPFPEAPNDLGWLALAMLAFVAFAFLLATALALMIKGKNRRAATVGVLALPALALAAWSISQGNEARNRYQEQIQIHQQQIEQGTAQQQDQIDDGYDLEGITLQSPPDELLCVNGAEQTRTLEAAWSGGYGRAVVGPEQDGSCTFTLFDEAGRRIEPGA